MKLSTDNPFSPGSDTVPVIWAGRLEQLHDWQAIVRPRRAAGLAERGRTYLGEAGLGKSTLVRKIAIEAEADGDWVTPQIRLPLGADPLRALAQSLLTLAEASGVAKERRLKSLIDRVRAVSIHGFSLTIEKATGPEPYVSLTEILVEIGLAAAKQNSVVLVHIDELQNVTNANAMSQLLVALGDAITFEHKVKAPGGAVLNRAVPIAVYLTGLPEFADLTGSQKGATFARRFATKVLEPLTDDDLRMALQPFIAEGWVTSNQTRIWMEPDAVEELIRLCCGEPFLFQLAGERAWYAGTGDTITLDEVRRGWAGAADEAMSHVERILERLPERERQMLAAMAELEPSERTLTQLASKMGLRDVTKAGPTGQRLDTVRHIIQRGTPYQFRHRAIEAYLTSNWPNT